MRKNWLDEEPSTHFSFQKWDFGHKVTKICSKTYINDFCFSPFLIDFFYFFPQKTKFSIKDFFSKCDQIRLFLRMWSHLLKKSFMENFVFCAATDMQFFKPKTWLVCRINTRSYLVIKNNFNKKMISGAKEAFITSLDKWNISIEKIEINLLLIVHLYVWSHVNL